MKILVTFIALTFVMQLAYFFVLVDLHNKNRVLEESVKELVADCPVVDKVQVEPKPNKPMTLRDLAFKMDRKYNLPSGLVSAVVEVESGYNPTAVGGKAVGLMQIEPQSAKYFCGVHDRESLFNPVLNLTCGSKILSKHYKKYKRIDIALSAYNAGIGWVAKYNGFVPFTKNYVLKVKSKMEKEKENEI